MLFSPLAFSNPGDQSAGDVAHDGSYRSHAGCLQDITERNARPYGADCSS